MEWKVLLISLAYLYVLRPPVVGCSYAQMGGRDRIDRHPLRIMARGITHCRYTLACKLADSTLVGAATTSTCMYNEDTASMQASTRDKGM